MRRPWWGLASVILQILDIRLYTDKGFAGKYSTSFLGYVKQNYGKSVIRGGFFLQKGKQGSVAHVDFF